MPISLPVLSAILFSWIALGGVKKPSVVPASLPACNQTVTPIMTNTGTKVVGTAEDYLFAGNIQCKLHFPREVLIPTLKSRYGRSFTKKAFLEMITDANEAEQPGGNWLFQAILHTASPQKTNITANFSITGTQEFQFQTISTEITGQGDGKWLRKLREIIQLTPIEGSHSQNNDWKLSLFRETQIERPELVLGRVPTGIFLPQAKDGLASSLKKSLSEEAKTLLQLLTPFRQQD